MRLFIVGQKWLAEQAVHQAASWGCSVSGARAPDASDRLALACAALGAPVSVRPDKEPVRPEEIPEGVDLIIAAHAHAFITPAAIARARLGAVGYHPSLLPAYKGRHAIRNALAASEAVTGGTVWRLTERYDEGPILLQEACAIRPSDTPADLWRRDLAPMGLRLLEETIKMLQA